MKNILCFLLSFVLIVNIFTDNRVYAVTEDTTAPTLVSVNIDKREVLAGDTITFTVEATDDYSGIRYCRLVVQMPITGKTETITCESIGYDLYQGSIQTDDTFENGEWQISYIFAYDEEWNSTYLYNTSVHTSSYYQDKGTDLSHCNFMFSGGDNADVERPEFIGVSVDKTKVRRGGDITFTIEATDDFSGIRECDLFFESPTGEIEIYHPKSIGYDLYSVTIPIVSNFEIGKWKVMAIWLYDEQLNETKCNSYGPNNYDFSHCDFEVYEGATVYLKLDKMSASLNVGDTIKLNPSYTCDDDLTEENYVWSSSNENIVTVDQNGNITAVSNGNATITVRLANGEARCDVCVVEEQNCLNSVVIKSSTTFSNETITKNVYIPKGVTVTTNNNVTFKGNVYVEGTLINNGNLTCEKELHCLNYNSMMSAGSYNYGYFKNYGSSKIKSMIVKATFLNMMISDIPHIWNAEYTIDVEPSFTDTGLKSIHCQLCNEIKEGSEIVIPVLDTFEIDALLILEVNETNKINVTQNGNAYSKNDLTWKSSASTIATVDQNGNVKGVKDGITTITVTNSNGYSQKCKIVVCSETVNLEIGTPLEKTYYFNSNVSLNLTLGDSNLVAANVTGTGYAWGSSMSYSREVTFYGNEPGTTYIEMRNGNGAIISNGRIKVNVNAQPIEEDLLVGEAYETELVMTSDIDLKLNESYSGFKVVSKVKTSSSTTINGVSTSVEYYTYKLKFVFDKEGDYQFNLLNENNDIIQIYKFHVSKVNADSIELSEMELKLFINEEFTLKATIYPSNTTNKDITWSSKNDRIATVSNGKVKAISEGTTTIIATTSNGKIAYCDITVKEKDVKNIEVTSLPTKINYLEGKDTLDLTNGKITIYYDNGTSEVIDLDETLVTGFDNTILGTQELSVTYESCTTTFEITIIPKTLTSIEVTSLPYKNEYIQKHEKLDVTGGKVTLYYNNDTTEEIDLKADYITGFDNAKLGKQTLTVTYKGIKTTFQIIIKEDKVISIDIEKLPTKTIYIEGDELDLSGGEIFLTYESLSSKKISMDDEALVTVTGFDCTKVGTHTLTVAYKGFVTYFDVIIREKSVSSIEMASLPSKLTYLEGKDALDLTNGKITIYYDNGTSEVTDLDETFVTGFDNTKIGSQTLTVTYQGIITNFDVIIQEKSISSIEVSTLPTKLNYWEGTDSLDLHKGKLTIHYNNGTEEIIDLNEAEVTGFDNSIVGYQELIVTYKGATTSFNVYIQKNSPISIEIVSLPNKLNYYIGEAFDITGASINIIYESGKIVHANLPYDGVICNGFDSSTIGDKVVTIRYKSLNDTFMINVSNKEPIVVESIYFGQDVYYCQVGDSLVVDFVMTPTNAVTAFISNGWDSNLFDIDLSLENCLIYITAKKAGEGILSITCDNGVTAMCTIISEYPDPFTDIRNPNIWYYEYVLKANHLGLMTGIDATHFGPNNTMTRGMVATVLYRMAGNPKIDAQQIFADVKNPNLWFFKPIAWAYQEGIVTGHGGTNLFKPSDNITRQEFALMLMRYANSLGLDVISDVDLSTYPDAKEVSSWASAALKWAIKEGIMSGGADGYLRPLKPANRAECAKMLTNFYDLINE